MDIESDEKINYYISNDWIKFLNHFNDNPLPIIIKEKKYTKIAFGFDFNQSLDNLPNYITYLHFSDNFNQPINNLPLSIESIYLGKGFNQPLDFLPEGIKKIIITNNNYQYDLMNLPKSVNNLRVKKSFKGKTNIKYIYYDD